MTLGACAPSNEPDARALPVAPAYVRPVNVVDPREGEDALAIAARERAGRVAANRVIGNFSAWYECVRTRYAGKRASECR